MCGRFTETVTYEKLEKRFAIQRAAQKKIKPRYNIAPGQEVAVITGHDDRALRMMTWGLALAGGRLAINARAETVAEKPAFRGLLPDQRCLIPADGFYEWQKGAGGRVKRPIRFVRKDREPFAFAGLWDAGLFTIITTRANECVRPYHERMPVMLWPEHEASWLDPSLSLSRIPDILVPYPDDAMEGYAVSHLVNRVANDSPECIQPAPEHDPMLPGL